MIVILVSVQAALILYAYAWWSLGFTNNWEVDLAAVSLREPLRKLVQISALAARSFADRTKDLANPHKLIRKAQDVQVKFGEMNTTRGQEEGVLLIGEKDKSILKLKKGRNYI